MVVLHVEIGIDAARCSAWSPGVEESFWRFLWVVCSQGKVKEKWGVFVGCILGTEDEDSHKIESRFVCSY